MNKSAEFIAEAGVLLASVANIQNLAVFSVSIEHDKISITFREGKTLTSTRTWYRLEHLRDYVESISKKH